MASHTRKGKAAVATWKSVVPFGATPNITYSNNPKGGVVPAISKVIKTKRPNQIKLNPNCSAKGKKMGTVISIIEVASINIPRAIKIKNIKNKIQYLEISKPVTHSSKPALAPE